MLNGAASGLRMGFIAVSTSPDKSFGRARERTGGCCVFHFPPFRTDVADKNNRFFRLILILDRPVQDGWVGESLGRYGDGENWFHAAMGGGSGLLYSTEA